jgi:hypothetical protein
MRCFSMSRPRKFTTSGSASSTAVASPSIFSSVEKYGEKKKSCRSRLSETASAISPSCSRTSSSLPASSAASKRARA